MKVKSIPHIRQELFSPLAQTKFLFHARFENVNSHFYNIHYNKIVAIQRGFKLEKYRGVYLPQEEYGLFEQEELKYQAQWYDENSLNEDKYERGGFYATEAEAIEGAIMGKLNQAMLLSLIEHQNDSDWPMEK